MRRFPAILFILTFIIHSVRGQDSLNVSLIGRWGKGQSKAVCRLDGTAYTFVGNGSYLEVYKKENGSYQRKDLILIQGIVEDISIKIDTAYLLHANVFMACGDHGLQVAVFNMEQTSPMFERFDGGIIRSFDTDGYANGVIPYYSPFGEMVCVADGMNGFIVINIWRSPTPKAEGKISLGGFAHNIWLIDNETVLVAAGTAGLVSIRIIDPTNPIILDTLQFAGVFPNTTPIAYDVIANDSVAYVADGWGGMRAVNILNPSQLQLWGYPAPGAGTWTYGGTKVDVRSIAFVDTVVYLVGSELQAGQQVGRLYGPVTITDPSNLGLPRYIFNTGGFPTAITIERDTVFIGDGYNGQQLVLLGQGLPPTFPPSGPRPAIHSADRTYDIALDTLRNYGYLATGKTGVRIVDLSGAGAPQDTLREIGMYNTLGEARGIVYSSNRVYIGDGSRGLTVLNVSNPAAPTLPDASYAGVAQGDTCYGLDLSSTYAFMASGSDGIHVIDISMNVQEIAASPFDTPGSARDVKFLNNKIFIADSSGVYIYNTSGLPASIGTPIASLTSGNVQAMGIDAVGDTVFVANGQYGFLLWNYVTGSVDRVQFAGFCNDIFVENGTIHISDSQYGLRIYDYSKMEDLASPVGYYSSFGTGSGISASNEDVCLADGEDGLYVFQSFIQPNMVLNTDTLDFGPVPYERSRSLILWIWNNGTAMLKGTLAVHPNIDEEVHTDFEIFEIPRGDSLRILVTFTSKNPSYSLTNYTYGDMYIKNTNDPSQTNKTITVRWKGARKIEESPYLTDDASIALWHLNETTGATTVTDASGNGLTGQVVGSPVWETSSKSGFGNAVNFNGNNGRIQVPYNSLLNFSQNTFTVELWFKMVTKPATYAVLLQRGQSSTNQYTIGLANDGQTEAGVYASVRDDEIHSYMLHTGSMAALNINQWYHVAFTWDSDSLRLYLNGILKDSEVLHGYLIPNTTDPVTIGARTDGQSRFGGTIDEIRLSNLARQPWEMHVNKSNLKTENTYIDFGDVFVDQSRRVPVTFRNGGTDSLHVQNIFSPSSKITISFDSEFVLGAGEQSKVWVTYRAGSVGAFVPNDKIVIQSSDPTFPYFELPCVGKGINQLTADPYVSDVFTLGLYHLDENSGTTLVDASGSGMNGKCSGNITWSSGNFSRALVFDNPNDICVIKPDTSLHLISPGLGGFSVETWFYMETVPSGESVLISRGDASGSQFDLRLSGNAVEAILCNTVRDTFKLTSQTLTNPLVVHKWYHTAVTYQEDKDINRGTMRLFVNGEAVAEAMMSGKIAGTNRAEWVDTLSIRIGRDWNSNAPFNGRIDEVRISQIDRQFWEFNMKLARLSISADTVVFGNVRVGNQRSIRVWFNNNGRDTLRVSNLVPNNVNFSVDLVNFSVAPGDSQYVQVKYEPLTEATHTGKLTMGSNDPLLPTAIISVRGTGVVENPAGPYESDSFTLALFDFNTVHGDTVFDSSGEGHYGFLHNGVSQTDSSNGLFSNGLYFDGVNGWVEIPSHPDFDLELSSESFTIEFLFKTGSFSQSIIYKGNASTVNYGISLDADGRLYVNGFTSLMTGTERTFPVNDRSWHHVAFIYENGDSFGKLYVGGILYDSLEANVGMDVVTNPLSVGSMTGTSVYFNGYIDQLRFSNLARETWEFPQSESGIYMVSTYPDTAVFGQNVTIDVRVPEILSATEVATFYRRTVGRGSYQKAVGTRDTTDFSIYTMVLPKTSIYPEDSEDLQGIEYYISVITPDSTYTIPSDNPKNKPKALIVRYTDMSAGLTYYTQEKEEEGYQTASMFSIPFSLDAKDAESVLEDLGEYDPYKWNLYKYDETIAYYRSYVDSTELFTFLPGQAFWLVTPMNKNFQIGPGVTVPSDWSYVISMSPGWNMIGTPYNQKTVWNSQSELVNTLYCWNGVDYDTCGSMQPWRGYWIHNPSTVSEMLYVSPSTVQITKPNSAHRQNISQNMQGGDWLLRVSAETGGVKDLINYAGVRKNALEGRDLYDRVEPPPPMGKYLSLFFDHRNWKDYQGIYSVDVRNPGQDGYVWPMSITTPMLEETIQVHWTFDQSLPQDWGAYLFDGYEGYSQNLLQGKSFSYETGKVKPDRRVFKLVIGTKNFIESERDGISLEPHEFTLFQNYPNPFNPTTDIRYTLPRRSDVELVVFNAIGQQVRVLTKENQKAGVHQVVWDGKDYNGRTVSSGLYFCRLIASEKVATRKMIVLK